MKKFLSELNHRNKVLFYFGLLNLLAALVCIIIMQFPHPIVLGINAWIKPTKFYLSIWIFSWTMAWLMVYLNKPVTAIAYSWMVVVVMSFETFVITWQAANGRLSHFNVSTSLYGLLFTLMGIAISILVFWTAYIGYLLFRKKQFDIPLRYVWGIRLGIIFFVIFSLEGGYMAAKLSHTVGARDGGPGLPVINWSTLYGDLRVAHFIGIHSLQILPLFGYFVARNVRSVQLFGFGYFIFTLLLFVQALNSIPLFF